MQHVNQALISITNTFTFTVDQQSTPNPAAWVEISERFDGSVKEAVEALELQLRKLLGDIE